jgi:hypothetical protein
MTFPNTVTKHVKSDVVLNLVLIMLVHNTFELLLINGKAMLQAGRS